VWRVYLSLEFYMEFTKVKKSFISNTLFTDEGKQGKFQTEIYIKLVKSHVRNCLVIPTSFPTIGKLHITISEYTLNYYIVLTIYSSSTNVQTYKLQRERTKSFTNQLYYKITINFLPLFFSLLSLREH